MFCALRKSIALVMFVIFMANLGLWNSQAQPDHGPAASFAHIAVALHEARADAFQTPFVPASTSESLFRPPRSSLSPG